MKKVDGYARVVTNEKGEIIKVEEWYSFNKSLQTYLEEVSFQDWIDESEYMDSEVLITYSYWSDKCWTDCGYEYDAGLDIINEILLGENYRETFKNKILDLKDRISKEENAFFWEQDEIGFPEKSDSESYLQCLIGDYEELYGEIDL